MRINRGGRRGVVKEGRCGEGGKGPRERRMKMTS